MAPEPSDTWLSLDEAARRVGVGRMRMREAIAAGLCEARRDNHGRWRLALGGDLAALKSRIAAARLAPEALVEILFDEAEDANLRLADREASLARMSAIVSRQQEIIGRALSLAEDRPPGDQPIDADRIAAADARAASLIDAALAKLSARDDEVFKLTGLLDRAFATIESLEGEVKRQAGVTERQKGLLDRLLVLVTASLDRIAGGETRDGGLLSRLRERLSGNRGG